MPIPDQLIPAVPPSTLILSLGEGEAASRTERFDQAVQAIASGIETGTIRNVEYKAAKEALGRAADQAWKTEVSEPFFYAGRYHDQPEAVRKLQDSIMIMSLHDVLATARKLAKTTATGPVIEAELDSRLRASGRRTTGTPD